MQEPTTVFEIPATSMSSHEVVVEVDGRRIVTTGVQVRITVREVTFMDSRREAIAAGTASKSAVGDE